MDGKTSSTARSEDLAMKRKELTHKILFEYLGFNGGDKLVTVSPETMLELAASVEQISSDYEAEIPETFFAPVKRELCEQIETAFLSFQQPKKK